jgi:mannose-6-phosphate isomerase class I
MALLPIRMFPAFRYGLDTPWGGNKLADEFGINIPDERTGECLEVSVLPGLNSTNYNRLTLTDLIKQYGPHLTGTRVGIEFPLLLKLIDAREKLSVQVHPDDELASKWEGKSGKSEAWVVLRAEPGACILYGIKDNITPEMLRDAALKGSEIERLLHSVPVYAGNVIDIPAGTIHAIGAGITLYEIQQSSDVTYRLYDWQRVDISGSMRVLHTEKALAAANISNRYSPVKPIVISQTTSGIGVQLLKNEHFTLERWTECVNVPLRPDPERFKIVTALGKIVLRSEEDGSEIMHANRIESILLPADGIPMVATCDDFLVVFPTLQP